MRCSLFLYLYKKQTAPRTGGGPANRKQVCICTHLALSLGYVSEENIAAEFQKYRTGGACPLPGRQLSGRRQRSRQDQRHRRGLLPVDVQVVAAHDRRAEHPPRRRLLPRRRAVSHRRGKERKHRVLLLAQRRQSAQTQRQGVRTALGPRGACPRRDRIAGGQRPDQRRRGRTAPLPQRLHLAAGPELSGRRDALQRRAGRAQPAAQEHARRDDAADLRHAARRTGRADSRPEAGVRRAAATRGGGVLPHTFGRPRAGRTALQIGTERPSVR